MPTIRPSVIVIIATLRFRPLSNGKLGAPLQAAYFHYAYGTDKTFHAMVHRTRFQGVCVKSALPSNVVRVWVIMGFDLCTLESLHHTPEYLSV